MVCLSAYTTVVRHVGASRKRVWMGFRRRYDTPRHRCNCRRHRRGFYFPLRDARTVNIVSRDMMAGESEKVEMVCGCRNHSVLRLVVPRRRCQSGRSQVRSSIVTIAFRGDGRVILDDTRCLSLSAKTMRFPGQPGRQRRVGPPRHWPDHQKRQQRQPGLRPTEVQQQLPMATGHAAGGTSLACR